MKKCYLLLYLLISNLSYAQLHGSILDSRNGESLNGATVQNKTNHHSIITNKYGFFSIDTHENDTIVVTMVGYNKYILAIERTMDYQKPIVIYLEQRSVNLEEVVINGTKEKLFNKSGEVTLTSNQLKKMNLLLGEKDPIKGLHLLPGIQEISEGSSNTSVRGGDADQNLLILDEGVVYNANHLFGFFSTFNADPIQKVDIYKSFFPAQYGGRLSSIIDVKMKEGNKNKLEVNGGIGLISSRINIEGPIIKKKASFNLSARRTYADLLLVPLQSKQEKTGYYFGDINLKANVDLNPKNTLFLSCYLGKDNFYQKNKIPKRDDYLLNNTLLDWGNTTAIVRWNRIINSKLFQNVNLIQTFYNVDFGENTDLNYLDPPKIQSLNMSSKTKDITLKIDYDYFLKNNLNLKYGVNITKHIFNPRNFEYLTNDTFESSFVDNADKINKIESAAYINLRGDFERYFFQTGVRFSQYGVLSNVYPEPRISFGRNLNKNSSVSISYSKMNQFLHLISNTGNGLPTDVWIPSTELLNKGRSDLINLNYSLQVNKGFTVMFDTYYKWIKGNTSYKSGANFLNITQGLSKTPFDWQNVLLQGVSWNYGYELSLQKSSGKFTYFGGYTLSWSISQFAELNNNKPFFNTQDRRHIFEIAAFYQFKPKISFSANVLYKSGNYISIPDAFFFRQDKYFNYLEHFSNTNRFHAENYYRLDIGATIKHKRGSWEFSAYNVTNRKNPYYYDTIDVIDQMNRTAKVQLKKQYLLPIVPSITYNFSF